MCYWKFYRPQMCPLPPALSLLCWRVLVSAWGIGSSRSASWSKQLPWTNSTTLDIGVKVWLLATMEAPSQAVIASMLDGIESEGISLEEVTSFSGFTKGFGKKRRKVWGKCAVDTELDYSGSAEEKGDVTEKQKFDFREWKKRERVKFKNMKSKIMCLESSKNFFSMLDASRIGTSLDKGWVQLMIHGGKTVPKERQTWH